MADFFWPDTVQVTIHGHDAANNKLMNVFHVQTPDTPTGEDCVNVRDIVRAWVAGDYSNCWAETTSADRVVVTSVAAVNGPQREVNLTVAGELIGPPLPSSNTLAVKKSTGLSGRANRGDWYVWAPTVNQIEILDGNLFLESYRDTCVESLNNLRLALLAASYILVVASQATGDTTVVEDFVATDRKVDSQSRRLSGRGD